MFNILKRNSIGLDIADNTIEAVELVRKAGKISIKAKGRIILESGVVEHGRIKDEEKLIQEVKKVLKKIVFDSSKNKEVVFGLPESQVFTHAFQLESDDKDQREDLIKEEVESTMPIKKESLVFSYSILNEKGNSVDVLTVASRRKVIKEWQSFFKKANLEINFFDIENLAVFRDLFKKPTSNPICLVDIGAETSSISIFNKYGLHYSHTVPIAGNHFTEIIAQELKIKIPTAEEKKINMGLEMREKKAVNALKDSFNFIIENIKSIIRYFEEENNQNIKEVVLVGGSSQLKGLRDYFKENIKLEVRIGQSALLKGKELEYLGAIGLAMKPFNKRWLKNDPVIPLALEKKKVKKGKNIKFSLSIFPGSEEKPAVSRDKIHSQIILLSSILVIGVILIGVAFWYRSNEKEKRAEEIQETIVVYTNVQSLNLSVPVATVPEEYTNDRVRGRLVEIKIEKAENYNEAIDLALKSVKEELEEGEAVADASVEKVEAEEVNFPLTIKLLIYRDIEANKLFLEKLDQLNDKNIDYSFNFIEIGDIESTENQDVFNINGEVNVSLNELINIQ